ncbi:MAG TPA: class I SAM-dependent methyltransferase, partial [Pyrinomonadaceae bacterium]|nr:class I SAM-dependent methyltransferase [Pyrinomonadaceae bacterium]
MSKTRTADELKHAKAVREMFSGIAGKYDFLNHLLSANIDKRWRKLVSKRLTGVLQNPNAKVLDVACGTGDLAVELKKNANAKIIGTDFCRPMLEIAHKKDVSIPFIEADGMNLSFEEKTFDAVTIAFGLR